MFVPGAKKPAPKKVNNKVKVSVSKKPKPLPKKKVDTRAEAKQKSKEMNGTVVITVGKTKHTFIKGLKEEHYFFCEAMLNGKNIKDSVKTAYPNSVYSNASSVGYKLLKRPDVKEYMDKHTQDKQMAVIKENIMEKMDFNNMNKSDILNKRSEISQLIITGKIDRSTAEIILKNMDAAEKLLGMHDKDKGKQTGDIMLKYHGMTDLQLEQELAKRKIEEQKIDDEFNKILENS